MKLSDKTTSILSSFGAINNSIYIEPGNVIKVKPEISSSPTAKAIIDDEFPVAFGIYEVKKFLSLINLFDDPDLEFEDNVVYISDKRSKATWRSSPEENITHPPYDKDYKLPSVDAEFDLEEGDLERIVKSAATLQQPNIAIIGDSEKIYLSTYNAALPEKQKSPDGFQTEVGETDRKFTMIFDLPELNFIKNKYHVSLCFKGIGRFESDNITYWVSPNGKSKYD